MVKFINCGSMLLVCKQVMGQALVLKVLCSMLESTEVFFIMCVLCTMICKNPQGVRPGTVGCFG